MHAVRVLPDGDDTASVVVGNLHTSNVFHDPEVPRAEVERARAFVEGKAAPGEAIALAGDFDVTDPRLAGYWPPGAGIDDVLVRGAVVQDVTVWALERRMQDGLVLSDHAPVDCVLEVGA